MPNARVNFTLPLDVVQLLDTYGEEGGNRSALVSSLLQGYFKGDIGKNGSAAKVALMQNRIEALSSEMTTLNGALKEMMMASQREKSREEERKEVLREKIREWFDVEKYGGVEGWLAEQETFGKKSAKNNIRNGLRLLSEKNGTSLPNVTVLFKEVYPALGVFLDD